MFVLPSIDTSHMVSLLLPVLLAGGVFGAIVAWWHGQRGKRARRSEATSKGSKRTTVTAGPGILTNYSAFQNRLQKAIQGSRSGDGAPALFVLDLDKFRYINDGFGHTAGDALLEEVTMRISDLLRPNDIVARVSGDEFMVLVNRAASATAARDIAHRLYDVIGEEYRIAGQTVRLTASIGMAMAPRHGQTAEELTRSATAALSMVKRRGGDGVQLPSGAVTTDAAERLILETDLRRALERDEFELHYQPKFTLADNKMIGVEALIRWRHPERGIVPPGLFIPVAEATGLIVVIGDWVLREALAASVRWRATLPGSTPPPIAVNLSFKQFEQPDFFSSVKQTIKRSGARAQDIEFELTESIVMHNPEAALEILRRLRGLGVGLSIDDFGTGHSSLALLKDLPVQILKIDRSFLRDVPGEAAGTAIVDAIIAMASALGLDVIAEGVETEDQLDFLRARNCYAVQGYLLGRPMPEANFLELINQRHATPAVSPPVAARYLRVVAD